MRFSSFVAASASLLAAVQAATLTINTPTTTIQECHVLALAWTGGTAPYYLTVTGSSTSDLIEELNPTATDATSGSWLVSVPAGDQIVFVITDATGASATTSVLTVASGSSTACEGEISFSMSNSVYTASTTVASQSATSAAAAASTTTGSGSATTTKKSSSSGTASKTATSSGTSSGSSAASSAASATATDSDSAAGSLKGGVVVAGLGAVLAMLA